ncbi:hypothetical protein X801_03252, partial [Opisthorchis viverrini]
MTLLGKPCQGKPVDLVNGATLASKEPSNQQHSYLVHNTNRAQLDKKRNSLIFTDFYHKEQDGTTDRGQVSVNLCATDNSTTGFKEG